MKHIRQSGLSLVELMIALALSALLIAGVIQIFNSNKTAFRVQDAFARVQENGRITSEVVSREIRSAAYLGCAKGLSFTNNVDVSKFSLTAVKQALAFDGGNMVEAFNDVSNTTGTDLANYGLVVGTASGNIVSGTDVLILRGAGPCEGGKVVSYNSGGGGTAQFKIEDATACGLSQNDIVLVTNCQNSEMFAISNNPLSGGTKDTIAHADNVNNSSKLSGNYSDDDSYLMKYRENIFYIGVGASGRNALFQMQFSGQKVETFELAEGVDDLQVLMGEDSDEDGTVNRYLEPGTTGLDNEKVVSVKTSFTLSSENSVDQGAGNQVVQTSLQSITTVRNRVK
ncbi:prepilin-type N-terminal cleavage/methylation domain-containing protein [Hahella sp. KA22]|uniref:PilW family protein n=1 Tax=Hahella sp. KA22 TaxID=1628392 RepID=UPI000FDD7725|nr:PilW family protein [Hahella sp. KA22]AZZ94362.1 prepilin-type N-terminal cleavage/methylation domain-containing protein [Hahella sp. KA22]QAY57736.1 prepilin-type N-terminal cleavage/methylation domain-containing protein [Hahella sp. KA22]